MRLSNRLPTSLPYLASLATRAEGERMEGKDVAALVWLVNDRVCEVEEASLCPEAAFWRECGWPACEDQVQLTLREYDLTGAPLLARGHTARRKKPLPATVVMSRSVAVQTGA